MLPLKWLTDSFFCTDLKCVGLQHAFNAEFITFLATMQHDFWKCCTLGQSVWFFQPSDKATVCFDV